MTYTTTDVPITPLLEDRSWFLLQQGYRFQYSKTLQEDREYLPIRYAASYKPFHLYEKNPSDPVAKKFIKTGGVYYPQEEFDTYVSLLGGSFTDIAFVLENFPHRTLILNEPNTDLYHIYQCLRYNAKDTIKVYETLVSNMCSLSNSKDANKFYQQVKREYFQETGKRAPHTNSGILLFLLDTGGFYSDFFGEEGISFYSSRIKSLWNWHNVLSSPLVSLYNTLEYTSLPLPTTGKTFIVANTPDYDTRSSPTTWNHKQIRLFTDYYNYLHNSDYDYSLLVQGNTNPTFRSQLHNKAGWKTRLVVDKQVLDSPFYEGDILSNKYTKSGLNNIYRCVVSNYELLLPSNNLNPTKDRFHTREFLQLYINYCSGLL